MLDLPDFFTITGKIVLILSPNHPHLGELR